MLNTHIPPANFTSLRLVGSSEAPSATGRWDKCFAYNADRLHVQGLSDGNWVDVQVFDGLIDNAMLGEIALISLRLKLPLTIDPSLRTD